MFTALSASVTAAWSIVFVTIQLASSQPTVDVINNHNYVTCDVDVQQSLTTLETKLAELQTRIDELEAATESNKAPTGCAACPAGFTYVPSVNGCYHLVLDNLAWDAAAERCQSLHKKAHLVVINNAAEQSAVSNMVATSSDSNLQGCINPVYPSLWTAGQRIDPSTNSSFVWRIKSTSSDTTDVVINMNYTAWALNQPDYCVCGMSLGENCMQLWYTLNQWNDNHCSRQFCSLCEVEVDG